MSEETHDPELYGRIEIIEAAVEDYKKHKGDKANPHAVTATQTAAAAADHDHDAAYAKLAHDHDAAYAKTSHKHDADYAAKAHNHDATYAKAVHNHDAAYAPKQHQHADLATVAALNALTQAVQDAREYMEIPYIDSVSPDKGKAGTKVTLEGAFFDGAATVKVGDKSATAAVSGKGTKLEFVVPSGLTAGSHDLAVMGAGGTPKKMASKKSAFEVTK